MYNPNHNSTTKQHAIVSIQVNTVACPTYPEKLLRDDVVAPFVPTSAVTVKLPRISSFATNDFMPLCSYSFSYCLFSTRNIFEFLINFNLLSFLTVTTFSDSAVKSQSIFLLPYAPALVIKERRILKVIAHLNKSSLLTLTAKPSSNWKTPIELRHWKNRTKFEVSYTS